MKNNERTCPKCGQIYNEYPAISRLDNKTEICPDCGSKEALEQFTNYINETKEDKQLEIAIIPMKKDNLIFEITNFGYLKANDLCDYLLDNFDFITKKMETVIPSLENFLIYGKPIERAFYNLEDNTIIIYYK